MGEVTFWNINFAKGASRTGSRSTTGY